MFDTGAMLAGSSSSAPPAAGDPENSDDAEESAPAGVLAGQVSASDLPGALGGTVSGGLQTGLLPLSDSTRHLLPGGGLRPGSLVQVSGSAGATTMALALLAGPCRGGAWVGCVGFPELGWEAAGEVGLPLQKVVAVGMPGDARSELWAKVMAAMVDAFEIVMCGPGVVATTTTVRKLRARARERGSVLVQVTARGPDPRASPVSPWSEGDVVLRVLESTWEGLGQGWGNLSRRTMVVQVGGRGSLSRPRHCEVTFGRSGCAEGGSLQVEHAGGNVVDLATRAG